MDPVPVRVDSALPLDLERTIFEIAAHAKLADIPKLMLVAQRIKHWLEPVLYRVVWPKGLSIVPSEASSHHEAVYGFPVVPVHILLAAITDKPSSFFATSVKYLFLEYTARDLPLPMDTILAACPRINDLFGHGILPTHLPTLNGLQCLRRLTINVAALFEGRGGVNFAEPVFRNLTHLEFLDDWKQDYPTSQYIQDVWTGLSLASNLTHIAFNASSDSVLTSARMQGNPHLHCIVIVSATSKTDEFRQFSDDARFLCIRQTNWTADWLRGTDSGNDYWALADRLIAARRAGKIDRSRYSFSDVEEWWKP